MMMMMMMIIWAYLGKSESLSNMKKYDVILFHWGTSTESRDKRERMTVLTASVPWGTREDCSSTLPQLWAFFSSKYLCGARWSLGSKEAMQVCYSSFAQIAFSFSHPCWFLLSGWVLHLHRTALALTLNKLPPADFQFERIVILAVEHKLACNFHPRSSNLCVFTSVDFLGL